MSHYTEKIESMTLPLVALRGIVAFPYIPFSFELSDTAAERACEKAIEDNSQVLLLAQRDISADKPKRRDFYSVGTVARIKQFVKLPEGTAKLTVETTSRASVKKLVLTGSYPYAEVICKTADYSDDGGIKGQALRQEILSVLGEFSKYLPKSAPDMKIALKSIKSPGILSDFIASNLLIGYDDKQLLLDEFDEYKRSELLCVIMEKEIKILETESVIHRKVRSQIEENQREYYLKEQLKAIQAELGYSDEQFGEAEEYFDAITKAHLPEKIEEKLLREANKLAKLPFSSAESGVIKNYLDVCLEVPFTKATKDRVDVAAAEKILDRDHDGLEKVKERILEYLAVKELNPDIKNQILCLVGPPGTGKTSIAASIASAMKRKYVRVSLGGVRDEADIRGHRRTYVAAMPGRIINVMRQAGVKNPVILLDEIDKMANDARGDPASALLEVLDSEQNKAFRDHFLEIPIDLGDCLFIATANSLENVARPLIDRMEIIELHSYSRREKLSIAKNHFVGKQRKRHGIPARSLKITDEALLCLIDNYTKEAGVRNLEREIGSICRKVARKLIADRNGVFKVTEAELEGLIGVPKFKPDELDFSNEVGVVNGLAFTELGGEMLRVEACVMPGTGKLELTGSLGDVMKESAKAAVSYIRANAETLKIDTMFYRDRDIHIHVPEGAVPKDGPSAGVTMVTALVSRLTGRPVRGDIAMTGEISLYGSVIEIGGLPEKTMAAFKNGIRTVLIPERNLVDLADIDCEVREKLHFIPCKTVSEVLENALV